MRSKKLRKLVNKKEELPSFLLNLDSVPEGIDIPPRSKKSASYLGPIFFGECLQFHPPHRLVPLSSHHHFQFSAASKENILKDIFLPKSVNLDTYYKSETFHPVIKPQKVFVDPYPHKCPGVRKIFAPDTPLSEGLGETKSVIEGEMSREIPFCRVKRVSSACDPQTSKTEFEVVTLSDIREENWASMSYKERIAHAHFPKEFVTVRVIGPAIPEAITITKLPSKRQTSYEIDLHLKSKALKTSNKKAEKVNKNTEEEIAVATNEKEEPKESALSFLIKKESSVEEEADIDSKQQESEDFEVQSDHQDSQIIRSKTEVDEEEEETLEAEAEESGEEKGNSQVFVDEEKAGSVEEESPQEAAED